MHKTFKQALLESVCIPAVCSTQVKLCHLYKEWQQKSSQEKHGALFRIGPGLWQQAAHPQHDSGTWTSEEKALCIVLAFILSHFRFLSSFLPLLVSHSAQLLPALSFFLHTALKLALRSKSGPPVVCGGKVVGRTSLNLRWTGVVKRSKR